MKFASALLCGLVWSGWWAVQPIFAAEIEDDSSAEARTVLDRMARAFRELNYDLSFVYIRDNQVEPMRYIHSFENGRERSRLVHLNGPSREIIREDDSVMAYFAESKPVMIDKADSGLFTRKLLDDLTRVKDSYHLSLGESARIAGRETQQLLIVSPSNERYGYRIWVDNKSGLLVRSELISDNSRIVEQWQVVSLDVVNKIPDSSLQVGFDVNAASGVRVLPASLTATDDTAVEWQVGWLPTGFMLRSHQTQQRSADDSVVHHLLFSDGVAAISVYVSKTPEGIAAAERIWRRGGMTIVETADRERRITVVGDIPSNTAKKIALSVRKEASLQP